MFKLKSVNLQVYIMLIAIAVIMAFFSVATDGAYLSARNISNLLRQTSITGILAIGMVFVIISAEIDLSVGSLMGLLGGFAAIADVWWGFPLPVTIIATIALGLIFGIWNGWWVAYRKVPSFIVTLAGYLAFRGILIGLTNGTTVSPISGTMTVIGQGYLSDIAGVILGGIVVIGFVLWGNYQRRSRQQLQLEVSALSKDFTKYALFAVIVLGAIYLLNDYRGIPFPVLVLPVLAILGLFLSRKTSFGRHVYAIGGNIDAAKLSGINVEKTKLIIFAMNGVLVAIAGLILSARLGAGSPSAGQNAELEAIAACVIGGASLAGGVGSRMGDAKLPTQYMNIGGKPIIIHTIEKFCLYDSFEEIVIACPKQWLQHTKDLIAKYIDDNEKITVIEGGKVRNETIVKSIDFIEKKYGIDENTIVVTHDAVRPFVTYRMIRDNIEMAKRFGACDTVIPATDTIVVSDDGEIISAIPDRTKVYQGQTPQSFKAKSFMELYEGLDEDTKKILTDAAKVFLLNGEEVHLVKGENYNIKITYPYDIAVAEALLKGEVEC